jgi:hypothetical protein
MMGYQQFGVAVRSGLRNRWLLPSVAALLLASLSQNSLADEPQIQFDGKQAFEVRGLTGEQFDAVAARYATKHAAAPLAVYVVSERGEPSKTPMDGTTSLEKGIVRFRTRFPLEPGMTYRAIFQPGGARAVPGSEVPLAQTFSIPKKQKGLATTIKAVFPTQDVLPENQLKFYLHFSAPMSRGEAYRHVHLLNEKGDAIDLPFLELDQELWDARQQRFTLFFDPGRIKRGLRPREEAGPVLEEGKRYTFVIDADWPDADGNPLAHGFRKSFRASPPDDQPIDPSLWKITSPRADSKEPLRIQFPKAMEHALAERLIWIEWSKGGRIPGVARVTEQEHGWEFRPDGKWTAGDYRIAVDSTVEDLAGNSIGRAFEIDVLRPVQKQVEVKITHLPFTVH